MKKNKLLLIFITLILLYTSLFYFLKPNKEKNATKATLITRKGNIDLEIARTEAEKRIGLMFRKNLCENCGMIFLFENDDARTFWMKNTYIPLDIIFVSANMKINNIFKNVPPQQDNVKESDIPIVSSKAKYVIELNANTAEKLGIKKEEKIKIRWR